MPPQATKGNGGLRSRRGIERSIQTRVPAAQDWDLYKDEILRLYLGKRLPLRAVKTIMDDNYKFGASPRMYKTRLQQWDVHKRQKLSKTAPNDHGDGEEKWVTSKLPSNCSCTKPDHLDPGRGSNTKWMHSESSVTLQQPEQTLVTSESSLNSSDSDLANCRLHRDIDGPVSVKDPSIASTELDIGSVPPPKQFCFGEESHDHAPFSDAQYLSVTCGFQSGSMMARSTCADGGLSTLASELDSLAENLCSPSSSVEDLQRSVNAWELITPNLSPRQMTKSQSQSTQQSAIIPPSEGSFQAEETFPVAQIGRDDVLNVTPAPTSQVDAYAESRGDSGPSIKWLSRAFLSCALCSQRKAEAAEYALGQTQSFFQEMARHNDPQILIAQLILLGVLHSHGQSALAGTLLGQTSNLVHQAYDRKDPIVTVTMWCHAIHGQNLSSTPINSNDLYRAHAMLSAQYGPKSPNALAALYVLSFAQISERQLKEGARNLHHLRILATSVLGRTHLVTIGSLTARARAVFCLGQIEDAINLMLDAGYRYKVALGCNHPLRLDQQRRLAAMYKELGGREGQIEAIYREVLEGRILTLGCEHPYTSGSYTDLIEFLKSKGKRDEAEDFGRSFEKVRVDGGYSVKSFEYY